MTADLEAPRLNSVDKLLNSLLTLGGHLAQYRAKVLCEEPAAFAVRFLEFGLEADPDVVARMESGDLSVPLGYWIAAWTVMGCCPGVVEATKCSAALYLASMKHLDGIEAEMVEALNRRREDQ